MPRMILHAVVIAVDTLVFGTLAIAGCLLVPNGNPLIWCARPWARVILWACGVKVRVRRPETAAPEPVIYVTNHQSHFDVLALIVALPGQYRIIAKKELFTIPVFGWALWLAGFIPIDRSDRDRAFRSLDEAAARIRRGHSIVVFAEGTRSPDGALMPFKKGGFVLAIRSGRPIVPISISGSRAVLSRNSLDVRSGPIDVVIGPPIPTAHHTFETRDALVRDVRQAIVAGFTELKRRDALEPVSGPAEPARGV